MTTGLRRDQQRGFEIRDGEVDAAAIADGSITPVKFNATVYGTGTTTIDPDDATGHGASTALARTDHQHQFTCSAPSSLTKTGTNTEGSGTSFVRNDHAHATTALPWGIVAQQELTSSESSAHSASGATDMALNNVSVVQGRRYAIHIHSPSTFTPGGSVAEWNVNLHLNGSAIATLYTAVAETINLTQHPTVDGTVYWTAPTTQATDDFTVELVEVSGSFTFQLTASATAPRWLTITDIGVAV